VVLFVVGRGAGQVALGHLAGLEGAGVGSGWANGGRPAADADRCPDPLLGHRWIDGTGGWGGHRRWGRDAAGVGGDTLPEGRGEYGDQEEGGRPGGGARAPSIWPSAGLAIRGPPGKSCWRRCSCHSLSGLARPWAHGCFGDVLTQASIEVGGRLTPAPGRMWRFRRNGSRSVSLTRRGSGNSQPPGVRSTPLPRR
jgi:hypothetical protein